MSDLINPFNDEYFMRKALEEAQVAFEKEEVPVGAVIVMDNQIIARAHNYTERLNDFTAHAEMQAYTSATEYLGNKYLDKCTLYVTLEPCIMCAGAAFWTRIGKIVYGASDERRGFLKEGKHLLHNKTELVGGVLEEDCGIIIKEFFKTKRNS